MATIPAQVRSRRRFSFQAKVLFPVLAFLILLPVVTVWLVDRHISEQARAEAQERLSAADAVFRNSVGIRARNLVSRYRNVVNEPRFKAVARLNDAQTTSGLLRDLLEESHDEAEVMFLSDEGNQFVAGVRRDPSLDLGSFARAAAPLTEPAILGELDAGLLVFGNRVFNIVAVPVFLDERSPPIGTLTIGVRFSDFALQELKSLTRTEIALISNGRVIAGTLHGPEVESKLRSAAGEPAATPALGKAEPATIDREHFHVLQGKLGDDRQSSTVNYGLLASYESRLEALVRTRLVLLGISAIGILVSVGTIWYLIGRITQPLRALRDGAEAVGRGEFSARVEKFSDDECGDLAESFNRMTSNLEGSHAQLKRTVNTLRSTQEQLVQREARLRESEEGLRLIIESARDHVIFTLDASGRVQRWNPAAERLLGYTVAEAEGLNYAHFFSPEDRSANLPHRLLAGTADDSRHTFEGWRVRRDGTKFWADITLSRLPGSGATGFVEITRDITIRKEAEEALRGARDAAESANRAKSEFIANVTHEFRTPMNGILGMTTLLLDQPLSEPQREFAETIRTSADGLLEIITAVLDLSTIEAGRLELKSQAVDLVQTIDALADQFATRAAKKRLELGFTVAPDVPALFLADDARLRQALTNLVDNAVKFTSEGSVAVTVEHAPGEGVHTAKFVVEDTGIGIAPDAQAQLFEPFSQADGSLARSFGGAGLGLAITKRLIDLMGGTIEVESTPGRGSRFVFTVPAPPAVADRTIGCLFPPLGPWRILVVAAGGLAAMLDRQSRWWGAQTQIASAAEALALRHAHFDAILIDENIVATESEGFLASLRRCCAAPAPTIVVIGSSLDAAGLAGIDRISTVGKPLKPGELHRALSARVASKRNDGTARAPAPTNPAVGENAIPLRILLVEDNAVNRKVALHLLKKLGYGADIATNGIEALDQLGKQDYDVVFMDLQMPLMDGLTATRTYRETHPASRPPYIVAFTANASKADREVSFAVGMHDFITKPAQLAKIAAALEHAREWLQSRPANRPATHG